MSIRITDLPEAGTLTGSEIIPVVQGGVTKKASTSALIVSAVTSLADHIADHSTHGTTGNIVGDTDVQTLANKSVSLASNTLTGNKSEFDAALSNGAFAYVDSANTFTVNQVVSVTDNTNAALRITQLGTGNALVVEDAANPDSTPFVIDASGKVLMGSTIGLNPSALLDTLGTGAPNVSFARFTNDASGQAIIASKSRGATVNSNVAVQNADVILNMVMRGADGTTYIDAASIQAAVDGTPGTNDMPGRLVFSTTADGASTPTERMRIDSQGRIGFNSTPVVSCNIQAIKATTDAAATTYGIHNQWEVSSVSGSNQHTGSLNIVVLKAAYAGTGLLVAELGSIASQTANTLANAISFRANASIATTGIISSYKGFSCSGVNIGSGSAGSQYGFVVESTFTEATGNYGFLGNIAAGAGRWNLFMQGTANNFFAGNVGIGSALPTTPLSVKGAADQTQVLIAGVTRGVRFFTNSVGTSIEGVDSTGVGSYQAISLGGSLVNFTISGANKALVDAAGNLLVTSAALLGYGAGSGGTVIQTTSKSTSVTLNKPTGQITLYGVNDAGGQLAAGASVNFTVNNSLVTVNDLVMVGGANAGVDPINYRIEASRANGNGDFAIRVTNISAGSLSQAVQIRFTVIKGSST